MKRLIGIVTTLLCVSAAAALAQHAHGHGKPDAKPIALRGEVVDLTCFMIHPENATGMEHAKCAKACVNKGLPIGFLAEDGSLYLLVGSGHDSVVAMVADVLGKKTTLNGTVIDHNGMKAFALVAGEPAGAAVYACPMHPDVRSEAPGKCSKCGMPLDLVK